uniref:Uncharacterized protein n=1 Tax=Arundo donax TaxID=35708 RepID=A0A0A8YVA0_ARUDO
MAQRLAMV